MEPLPLSDVLTDLAQQVDGLEGEIEGVSIEAANPQHYMVRVYLTGADDYEPFQVRGPDVS